MFGVGRGSLSTASKLAHIKELKCNSDTDKSDLKFIPPLKQKNTHASI